MSMIKGLGLDQVIPEDQGKRCVNPKFIYVYSSA